MAGLRIPETSRSEPGGQTEGHEPMLVAINSAGLRALPVAAQCESPERRGAGALCPASSRHSPHISLRLRLAEFLSACDIV